MLTILRMAWRRNGGGGAARRSGLALLPALLLCGSVGLAEEPPAVPPVRPLLITFSSFRDRPAFSSVYFYRHDGVGAGALAEGVPQIVERADTRPVLAADSSVCLYLSKQPGGHAPTIRLFDVKRKDWLPDPEFNAGEFSLRNDACLSGDGAIITCCGWDQAGQPGGWDVLVWDRRSKAFLDLPGLNSEADEREVVTSRAGRWLAVTSNRSGGEGLSDLYLYDRQVGQLVPLPGLNSPQRELNPALSADGRLIAFISDRPGGAGGKDLYLYDRQTQQVTAPPGLNSAGHEQSPTFSPDGRYLLFVSERTQGAGERDIFLYDLVLSRLLPTPGLNSTAEDFDPAAGFDPGAEDGMMPGR
jgi:hypothetical protein